LGRLASCKQLRERSDAREYRSATSAADLRSRSADTPLQSSQSDPGTNAIFSAHGTLADIRNLTGLTFEDIAPLVGVSRRSLHHWLAGGTISARKERRFRELADALRAIDRAAGDATRQRLFTRLSGGARLYDLLAAGKFAEASSLAGSARLHQPEFRRVSSKRIGPEVSIADRLDILPDRPSGSEGNINLKRSRRLKR
jgi:hypothetical protein